MFERQGNVFNLSRADPHDISQGVGNSYYHGIGGGDYVFFTQIVRIRTCNIIDLFTAKTGKTQKRIDGFLLNGEFERTVCMHTMITGSVKYKGPLGYGSCQFGTMWGNSGDFYLIPWLPSVSTYDAP